MKLTEDRGLARGQHQPTDDTPAFPWAAIRDRFGGGSGDSPAAAPPAFQETWILDIPEWQFQTVLTKLKAGDFYRRSKTVNATTFLATEIDGARFAKEYRDVPELDALIVRVRAGGVRLNSDPGRPERPGPPPDAPRLPPASGPPGPAANPPY